MKKITTIFLLLTFFIPSISFATYKVEFDNIEILLWRQKRKSAVEKFEDLYPLDLKNLTYREFLWYQNMLNISWKYDLSKLQKMSHEYVKLNPKYKNSAGIIVRMYPLKNPSKKCLDAKMIIPNDLFDKYLCIFYLKNWKDTNHEIFLSFLMSLLVFKKIDDIHEKMHFSSNMGNLIGFYTIHNNSNTIKNWMLNKIMWSYGKYILYQDKNFVNGYLLYALSIRHNCNELKSLKSKFLKNYIGDDNLKKHFLKAFHNSRCDSASQIIK